MYSLYMQLILAIFIILDFTIAKNLTLHNRYDPQNRELLDVKFSGNTMIITGNLNGTEFYDISDSLNPVHLSNLEIPFGNQNRALPNFIAATSALKNKLPKKISFKRISKARTYLFLTLGSVFFFAIVYYLVQKIKPDKNNQTSSIQTKAYGNEISDKSKLWVI